MPPTHAFGLLRKAGINYYQGNLEFSHPVLLEAGIVSILGRGKVFYVDSNNGSANNSGRSSRKALATIEQAVNKCTANQGDVIYVLPAHAENISAATSLVLDKAGITIIGLGVGSLRPKLSHTAAAGVIQVTAANVTVQNIVFEAAFADVTEAFNITTAKWFKVIDCIFQDAAVDENFLWIADIGTTDNAADGLSFIRCSWITPDLLTQSFVDVDADLDQLTFIECYANLGVNTSDLPVLANVANGKDLTNLNIQGNLLIRLNDANPTMIVFGNTTTTNTGVIARNGVAHRDVDSPVIVTAGTNIFFIENYQTDAIDESGFLLPAVGS